MDYYKGILRKCAHDLAKLILASIIRFVFRNNNEPVTMTSKPTDLHRRHFDRQYGRLHKLKKNMVFLDKPLNWSSHSYQIAKWNLYRTATLLDFCALIQAYKGIYAWTYFDPIDHQRPPQCYQLSTRCLWWWKNTFQPFFFTPVLRASLIGSIKSHCQLI